MEGSLGVRRGAWSKAEDDLLRACVQQYGEGKWHLVPQRGGLNRCRKSCRLRWLNYLKPSIKRGEFTEDEVDLMIRLHRLLGNRWSLIAGRLPGRTANDVKNYWNTYARKKLPSHKEDISEKPKETVNPHVVIKPQPRTFSRTSPWLRRKVLSEGTTQTCAGPSESNNWSKWWGTVMDDNGGNAENDSCCLGRQDGNLMTDPWDDDLTSLTTKSGDFLLEDQSWSDFFLDINLWDDA